MNKKTITKKFTALVLTLTMALGTIMPSFANEQDFKRYDSTENEHIMELTVEELVEILEITDDIEVIRKVNDSHYDSVVQYRSMGMTGSLDGSYELYVVGFGLIAFKIINDSIEFGGKVISMTSSAGKKIKHAVDNFIFAKNNPTGRTAREIEKRLKKEGFEKVKSNGGSHQQWKKGSRKVTVPKHGGGKDIDIKTLRSIWKQAGWL